MFDFVKTRCMLCDRSKTTLYRFPKDKKRLNTWLILIGKEDLFFKEDYYMKVHSYGRLCSTHFFNWCFSSTEKKRLIQYATPLIESPPCRSVNNKICVFNNTASASENQYIIVDALLPQPANSPPLLTCPKFDEECSNPNQASKILSIVYIRKMPESPTPPESVEENKLKRKNVAKINEEIKRKKKGRQSSEENLEIAAPSTSESLNTVIKEFESLPPSLKNNFSSLSNSILVPSYPAIEKNFFVPNIVEGSTVSLHPNHAIASEKTEHYSFLSVYKTQEPINPSISKTLDVMIKEDSLPPLLKNNCSPLNNSDSDSSSVRLSSLSENKFSVTNIFEKYSVDLQSKQTAISEETEDSAFMHNCNIERVPSNPSPSVMIKEESASPPPLCEKNFISLNTSYSDSPSARLFPLLENKISVTNIFEKYSVSFQPKQAVTSEQTEDCIMLCEHIKKESK